MVIVISTTGGTRLDSLGLQSSWLTGQAGQQDCRDPSLKVFVFVLRNKKPMRTFFDFLYIRLAELKFEAGDSWNFGVLVSDLYRIHAINSLLVDIPSLLVGTIQECPFLWNLNRTYRKAVKVDKSPDMFFGVFVFMAIYTRMARCLPKPKLKRIVVQM